MTAPFTFAGLLISGLIVLLLVAHLCWWLARVYFPSARFCATVHKNLPVWWGASVAQFTTNTNLDTTRFSVMGFVSSIIWPLVVLLNMLLLAQVFELFFDGGTRIPIPFVGKYAVFPLIMAALYAVAQSVLGIIFGQSKSRGVRALYMALIIIAIAVEMGLAWYRAYLITSGSEVASDAMWDQLFSYAGPVLAAFIGLIVPVVEISMGYLAFGSFIEPLAPMLLRWLRGIAGLLASSLAWLLFGFHHKSPVSLPGWLTELERSSVAMRRDTKRLRENIESLEQEVSLYQNPLASFDKMTARLDALEISAGTFQSGGDAPYDRLDEALRSAKSLTELDRVKKDLHKFDSASIEEATAMVSEASLLQSNLKAMPNLAARRQKFVSSVDMMLESCLLDINKLDKDFNELSAFVADIKAVLHNETRINPVLVDTQVEELKILQQPADESNNRSWARSVIDTIQGIFLSAREALPEADATLTSSKDRVNKLLAQKDSSAPTPMEVPDTVQIDTESNRAGTVSRIVKAELSHRQKYLADLQKRLAARYKELRPKSKFVQMFLNIITWVRTRKEKKASRVNLRPPVEIGADVAERN